jgi:hypothetical protein
LDEAGIVAHTEIADRIRKALAAFVDAITEEREHSDE